MSDQPPTIKVQAGIKVEFEIAFADIDDSTDPATETPVDLTGCTATMIFRSRDGISPELSLGIGTGLAITALDGVVGATLTAGQTSAMAPDKATGVSGRYAFKCDIINADDEPFLRGVGFLEVEAWDV